LWRDFSPKAVTLNRRPLFTAVLLAQQFPEAS
jgi:hypothetical protein